ncbi:hypothetical protein [Phytohabitans suffuscus]|nr:hypothetical protein [Phytohabitans suffuscus]
MIPISATPLLEPLAAGSTNTAISERFHLSGPRSASKGTTREPEGP